MAIKQIRLPDGSEVVIDEWLHYQQFSTIEFAAATAVNLRAFTYVWGPVARAPRPRPTRIRSLRPA
jgi:hypothetical protein